MTDLDTMLETNKRKKKSRKKKKMGNTTRVWRKDDLERSTVCIDD